MMRYRSPLFLFSVALGSCLVLIACLVAFGFGAFYLVSQGNLLWALGPANLNRIVYVGNDLNIYTVDPRGSQRTQLTKDGDGGSARAYDFPTWSPDNRHIAFVGVTYSGGSPSDGTLYSETTDGTTRVPLYKSDQSIPFYLYWSPDGHFVTFLSSKSNGQLALGLAQGDKENSTEELDSGAPLYFAWSPDSQRMLLHVGGALGDSNQARIALLPLAHRNSPQAISSSPGSFAAPQWSPDGQNLLFSTADTNNGQAMAVSDAHGQGIQVLFKYNGRISFSWSPSGDRIAYIVTESAVQIPNLGIVQVVDPDGKNAQDISKDPALAFFWSPNGKRLAYLTVQASSNSSGGRMIGLALQTSPSVKVQWNVKDFDNGTTRVVATFAPTDNFVNLLPFFDQYARSMTFWSPDSQSLVYASSESSNIGSIWIASVSAGTPPVKVGEGVFAAWSWK
jgi:Tol biopolymer transport system component